MGRIRGRTRQHQHRLFGQLSSHPYVVQHAAYHHAVVGDCERLWELINDAPFSQALYQQRLQVADVANLYRYGLAAHLCARDERIIERLVPLISLGGHRLSSIQQQLGHIFALYEERGDVSVLLQRIGSLSNAHYFRATMLLLSMPQTTEPDAQRIVQSLHEKMPNRELLDWTDVVSPFSMVHWCCAVARRFESLPLVSVLQFSQLQESATWKPLLTAFLDRGDPTLFPLANRVIAVVLESERARRELFNTLEKHASFAFVEQLISFLVLPQHPLWSQLSVEQRRRCFSSCAQPVALLKFLLGTVEESVQKTSFLLRRDHRDAAEEVADHLFEDLLLFVRTALQADKVDYSTHSFLKDDIDLAAQVGDRLFADEQWDLLSTLLEHAPIPKYAQWHCEHVKRKRIAEHGLWGHWRKRITRPVSVFFGLFFGLFSRDSKKRKLALALGAITIFAMLKSLFGSRKGKPSPARAATRARDKGKHESPSKLRARALRSGAYEDALSLSTSHKERFEVRFAQSRATGGADAAVREAADSYVAACLLKRSQRAQEDAEKQPRPLFSSEDEFVDERLLKQALGVLVQGGHLQPAMRWVEDLEDPWEWLCTLRYCGSAAWNQHSDARLTELIEAEEDPKLQLRYRLDLALSMQDTGRKQAIMELIQRQQDAVQVESLSHKLLCRSIDNPDLVHRVVKDLESKVQMDIFMECASRSIERKDVKSAVQYTESIPDELFRNMVFYISVYPLIIEMSLQEGEVDRAKALASQLKPDDVPWHFFLRHLLSVGDLEGAERMLAKAVQSVSDKLLLASKESRYLEIARALLQVADIDQRIQLADRSEHPYLRLWVRLLSFEQEVPADQLAAAYELRATLLHEEEDPRSCSFLRSKLQPDISVFLHWAIAEMQRRNGQHERALESLRAAMAAQRTAMEKSEDLVQRILQTLLLFPDSAQVCTARTELISLARESWTGNKRPEQLAQCICALVHHGRVQEAVQAHALLQESGREKGADGYAKHLAAVLSAWLRGGRPLQAQRLLEQEPSLKVTVVALVLAIDNEQDLLWAYRYLLNHPLPASVYPELISYLQMQCARVAPQRWRMLFAMLLLGFTGQTPVRGTLAALACAFVKSDDIEKYQQLCARCPDLHLPALGLPQGTGDDNGQPPGAT